MLNYGVCEKTEESARQIAAIEEQCFKSPWSFDAVCSELIGNDLCKFFVCEDGGKIIAYVGCWQLPGIECSIGNVAVSPDYRRQGIANHLLELLIQDCTLKNIGEITLEVRLSNLPALALYESFGFKEEGRRKAYYEDGEDAIIMWRR